MANWTGALTLRQNNVFGTPGKGMDLALLDHSCSNLYTGWKADTDGIWNIVRYPF